MIVYSFNWSITPNDSFIAEFDIPFPSIFERFEINAFGVVGGVSTVYSCFLTITFRNQSAQGVNVFDPPQNAVLTRASSQSSDLIFGVSHAAPRVEMQAQLPGNVKINVSGFAAEPPDVAGISSFNGVWRGYFKPL